MTYLSYSLPRQFEDKTENQTSSVLHTRYSKWEEMTHSEAKSSKK